MSLATRLSAFFLGTLALVLAGFAITLYLLASAYLYHQTDERLSTALDTLAAAVELEVDGLEWEPALRHLTLGRGTGPDEVRWELHDGEGRLVDRSANLSNASEVRLSASAAGADPHTAPLLQRPWRVAQRTLRFTPTSAAPTENKAADAGTRYPALVFTTGVTLEPLLTTTRALGFALAGLSVGLWLTVAVLGRWLSRRALAPLTRMAGAAEDMGIDLSQRLPDPSTRDELAALQRAFNGLLDRVQETFERQKQFTANASHQLRTPLTGLLGQVELALRRDRSGDEYRQTLAVVQSQAEQLRQMVDVLLFLARADSESQLPGIEPIDLGQWLPSYLHSWSDHPRAADLHLRPPVPGEYSIAAPPILLRQLVDNLVDNACKYSPPGTPITLTLQRSDGSIAVVVQDAGTGIAADDFPHIFAPFYRSDEARRAGRPGLGLGLAVAQRVATALSGSLSAASVSGQGSTFTLRLPQPR